MKKSNIIYLATFAISSSVLIFETASLRFLPLKLLGSWGFLVISTAFLGIGAAGTYLYLRGNKNLSDINFSFLFKFSTFYILSIASSVIIFVLLPFSFPQPGLEPSESGVSSEVIWGSLFYMLIFSVPFFLSGVCISYVLSIKTIPVGRTLFFDLMGAGTGAVLAVLFISKIGGYGILAISMVFAYMASLLFIKEAYYRRSAKIFVLHFLLFILFLSSLFIYPRVMINFSGFDIVAPKSLDGEFKEFKKNFNGLAATYWNPIARIDLSKEGQSDSEALLSGLSTKYRDKKYTGRYILVDVGAPTRQFNLGAEGKDSEFLGHFLYSIPYQLTNNNDNILIIGAGGGVEISIAKHFGIKNVDVAEINSATIEILKGENSKDLLGGVYSAFTSSDNETTVNLRNEEGRSYLSRRNIPKYDILQLTGVDLLSALKSGGLVLSDNYLYTQEALGYYYDALKDGGYAQITYWGGPHSLRLFITALSMLESRGNTEPHRSLVAVGDNVNLTNIIIKKGFFTDAETEKIKEIAKEDNFKVFFIPELKNEFLREIYKVRLGLAEDFDVNYWVEQKDAYILAATKESEFSDGVSMLKSLPFNLAPTYDDKPFFYAIYKDAVSAQEDDPAKKYSEASLQKTGRRLIAFGTVLAFLLILLPLFLKKKIPIPFRFTLFFMMVGAAFALFEVVLIQKFSIFVGGPFYSMSVTLPTILIFYSFGAFLASKMKLSSSWLLFISVVSIVVYGVFGYFFLDNIIKSLFYLGHLGRIMVMVSTICPIGFFLGFPTPIVLQVIKEKIGENVVPAMWGINSSGNVIGALLFGIVAQTTGFNLLLLASGFLYFVALAIVAPKIFVLTR